MVNLNSFFTHEINFNVVRVAIKDNVVDLVPRPSEGWLHRISRFVTFEKDPQLTTINKTLVKAFAGTLVEDISKEIFKKDVTKVNAIKNTFITNLTHLNGKFIKGNQTNFLTDIILKVVNFVRWIFGKERIGYQVLDVTDIEKKLNDNMINKFSQSPIKLELPPTNAITVYKSTDAKGTGFVPSGILALLDPACRQQTVDAEWNRMSMQQQLAVQLLLDKCEIKLSVHKFPLVNTGDPLNLGIEVEGDVTLQLEKKEFEDLQKALTGSIDNQSRFLTALVLVSAGNRAIDLVNFVNKNGTKSLEGIKALLLTGAPLAATDETKDKKSKPLGPTLFDRIMDPKNPPNLKIEGNPFSLRFDVKKRMFLIQNLSDAEMEVSFEGIMHNGRYLKASFNSPNKVHKLVKKGGAKQGLFELGMQENYYYKVSSGKSHFIISVENLKNLDGTTYQ